MLELMVRVDHFQVVSSEQPSNGPIVISSPLKYVQHHFGGHWPTSVREVHYGHILLKNSCRSLS